MKAENARMSLSARKRVITFDEETFEQLSQYAESQGVTPEQAACCFVRAGVQNIEYAERVSEMLEQHPTQ
jgi:hypothetical protein